MCPRLGGERSGSRGDDVNSPLVPAWLPQDLASVIDLTELALDEPGTRRELARLESETGHHIAAYREGAARRENALCSFLMAADVSGAVDRIRAAERRVPGVLFVAYRRPVAWRGD
jgi:hypothetical protein